MSALDTQVGGSHYKDLKIQPVEYITANNIPYMEGNVIKYVTRWREKGGLRDLEKAKHYLEMLIEMQNQKAKDGLLKLVEKELEDCKGDTGEKQAPELTMSAASVHYENIKSYIADNRIAPDLVDDYIKPVGRFVVKSVPMEVSIGVWTAFALANALEVQFIKQPMGLDGITRAYDVELWLKK